MVYIFGIIMIVVGIVLVVKTEWFLSVFGRIDWAEQKIGPEGGSRLFYKLLGIAFIFISLMMMTGIIESGLDKIFVR